MGVFRTHKTGMLSFCNSCIMIHSPEKQKLLEGR
jgi:hypothetical protein